MTEKVIKELKPARAFAFHLKGEKMTEQELKELASSMGYNLIKKTERKVKLKPCICGAKQMAIWHGNHTRTVCCPKCGKKATYEDKRDKYGRWTCLNPEIEKKAREAWNKMIEKEEA